MTTTRRITKLLRIAAKDLRIHPLVQRNIIPKHLEEMKQNFDLDSIGTLQAVRYPINGKEQLWIIDGQHRLKALMDLDLGDWEVDVLLHVNVKNDEEAAQKFLNHSNSRGLSSYHKFQQELITKNPIALGVLGILKERSITPVQAQTDGGVCCVTTLKRLYSTDNGFLLGLTLDTAIAAWGKTARALDGKLLDGLAYVLRSFRGELDIASLTVQLTKAVGGPAGIIGRARTLRDLRKMTLPKAVAEVIVGIYNVKRRSGKLEF